MNPSKLIALVLAGVLIFKGYEKGVPSPDIPDEESITVIYDEVEFPPTPTDPGTITILTQLDSLDITLVDAHALAMAFQQWAGHVEKDTKLTTLTQVTGVYTGAAQHLFPGNLEKNYAGKIDAVVESLYQYKLNFLKTEEGAIKSLDITPEVRKALVEWLNALSWKFSDIFALRVEEQNEIPTQTNS